MKRCNCQLSWMLLALPVLLLCVPATAQQPATPADVADNAGTDTGQPEPSTQSLEFPAATELTPPAASQLQAPEVYDEQRFVRHISGTETCLICHGSYNFVVAREGSPRHSLWLNTEVFLQSVHAKIGCNACHRNIDEHGHRLATRGEAVERMLQLGQQNGVGTNGKPAEPSPEDLPFGRDFTVTVALDACIQCHQKEFDAYRNSVHGEAKLSGLNPDAPFCTDCHGEHYILPRENELSRTNPANIPSTCLECHSQSDIKARAGLQRDVGTSFEQSFHGKRGMLGGVEVAVCNTCHGTHDIYRPNDPRSMVNREKIAKTCGECHDGAQLNFASAFTHSSVSRTEQVGLYVLKQVYKWAIFMLIGMFVLFAALDIYQYWRRGGFKRASAESDKETAPRKRSKVYERFNLHQRIQHFIMAFSFTALVMTGWPLRFPELRASQLASSLFGGVGVIGVMHRAFGIMLVVVSLYHLGYLALAFIRGKRSVAMLPSIVDAKEGLGDVQYWLGLKKHRPRFSRYNWIEKMEYYAVLWGTAVMILSGIVIWLPTFATRYMPAWVVSASVIFHGYEALLAGLAIFLWHFYWVHLHPEVYPMSLVWLTGKLTEEEMEHHHPRELQMLRDKQTAGMPVPDDQQPGKEGGQS